MTKNELMKELEYEIQYMAANTQNQYRAKVSDYLDWVKAHSDSLEMWKDRDTLYKYVEVLRKKRRLSQTTINFILRGAIGALFRMQQPPLRLPVKMPKMSRTQTEDISSRVHFTTEEIVQLIQAARKSGNPQWMNLMALSSIYMVRAGEITRLKKEDVHPNKHSIMIHTLKGGMLREHIVPPVLNPYVFKYDYPELPGKIVHNLFGRIAKDAGVSTVGRKNIHAVRHGVFTALKNLRDASDHLVFSPTDVYQFARWAGGGIGQAYNHPDNLENDERIFKHHPFLQYWK